MSTATLVYTVTAVAPVTPAQLVAALEAVKLDTDAIVTQTGCTFVSDTTAGSGLNAVRTVVFNLPAAFLANFPDGTNQRVPFNNLYKHAIGAQLGSVVVAAAPVIA